jgi:hypothetical protein
MFNPEEDEKKQCPPADEMEIPEPNIFHIPDTDSSISADQSKSVTLGKETKDEFCQLRHPDGVKKTDNKILSPEEKNILDIIFERKKSKKNEN